MLNWIEEVLSMVKTIWHCPYCGLVIERCRGDTKIKKCPGCERPMDVKIKENGNVKKLFKMED